MPTPAPVDTAPALTLRLLGPGVLLADGTAVRTHSARTFALLAYLALEPERPHARDTLVDLLWPDLPLASGRQNLRQALYSLRAVAGGRLGGCLQVDARSVQFLAPDRGLLDIDVHRFLTAVRSADDAHWRAAAALHHAPLLDGMAAVPGPTFDAWLLAARDRLGALALQNLGRLVTGHMARAEWDAAARHAQAMVALDATSEVASQYLLRIFAAQGLAQAVDAEWARLCAQLSQLLGVAPSAESAALHAALRRQVATPLGPSPARAATPGVAALAGGHAAGARDAEAMVWAAQAAERVFAYNHAADLYDRALRVMARGAPATAQQVDVLMRREAVLERLGRRADQALVIDDAMAMVQALGDQSRVAVVCLRRAGVCAYLRRHDEARAAAERALQIFRDLGDAPGEAEALRELGFTHWHAEQHAEALQRTREALDLHRRIGDATGEATALHNLAEVHRGLGSPRQGCQLFEQATRLHWATDNPAGEILSLFGWAQALRQAGDLPGSAEKLQAALKLTDLRGERVMHSRVLHALAMLHAADGSLDAAVDQMRRVIEIDRAIGYGHALGHDLIDLSNLHLQAGEVSQARVAMLEAMVWFGFADDDDAIASTQARLAVLEGDGAAGVLSMGTRGGVKSHLSLGEGKVYCEFESALGPARQP
jgi:DNA-binding SARP family transcriptional activator